MAGQAQKKAAKAASSTARFSGLCILVANTLYCLWLAAQALQGTERWAAYKGWGLTRRAFVWGGAAFAYWYAYTGLVTSAKRQTASSTYVDLLGLTVAAQLGSLVWDGAWLLLLLVPVVAVGSYLLPLIGLFIGASGGAGEGGSADADAKAIGRANDRRAFKTRIVG